jgi:hypothetical protein
LFPSVVRKARYTIGWSPIVEAASWTNVLGPLVAWGSNVMKLGLVAVWDSGAVSTKAIAFRRRLRRVHTVRFTRRRMFGLGNADTTTYYSDIEYAVYL